MSDELISLSDFLDWADFCASVYGRRSLTLMDGVTQDDYERVVTIGNEFIACCHIRERYLAVIDMALELQRFNDELIRRSTLLNFLHKGVDAYKKGMVASLKRAAEYGRRGCYADMLKECQDVMRHENARDVYQRLYSYVRYMPMAGTIEARLQKGVIIHEKH